jgi:hypothetical protein
VPQGPDIICTKISLEIERKLQGISLDDNGQTVRIYRTKKNITEKQTPLSYGDSHPTTIPVFDYLFLPPYSSYTRSVPLMIPRILILPITHNSCHTIISLHSLSNIIFIWSEEARLRTVGSSGTNSFQITRYLSLSTCFPIYRLITQFLL